MTHKHNFIFKAVSVLCMALVIVLLSSFVYPVANEVSAKETTPATVIIPPPYLASAPAVTEEAETQPEESVDVSAPRRSIYRGRPGFARKTNYRRNGSKLGIG